MKALALEAFDVAAVVIDVEDAVARPGEVLVTVDAASVNAFDLGVAAGFMKDYMPYEFPAVIGSDVTGTIERVGDGVEGFSVGDRVFGMMGMKGASTTARSPSERTHRPRPSRSRRRAFPMSTPDRSRWPARRP